TELGTLKQTVAPAPARLRDVDASVKWPAIFFLASSILWLLAGTVLALIASFSMHWLEFRTWTAETGIFTFGRARSAHLNAMIYGWGNNVGFAVAVWIMSRLCMTTVRHPTLLFLAGVFWNAGITIGIVGILFGDMTSVEWLEMPTYAAPILFVSYGLIGVWMALAFRYRQTNHTYVSQWYLLGATFWFPWLYAIAQIMILWLPAQGTIQSLTNWWFAHNVLGLWLTPLGLGAIYYFLPKVLGRPIHSYYLSILGFWSLALFYNWAGVHHLIGGPVPVWLQAAGTVGSIFMVIPVVVTAINHHLTAVQGWRAVWASPTLRFIVYGAMSYTLVSLIGSTMALRSVNEITHFTQFTVAHAHHGVYAFFTMVMFGSVYFFMPRLLFREWPSAALISVHFWTTAIGIGIYVVGLSLGGWLQGLEMHTLAQEEVLVSVEEPPSGTETFTNAQDQKYWLKDVVTPFDDIVKGLLPWLFSRSIAGVLLTIGHIAFAINFVWMVLGIRGTASGRGPTLLAPISDQARARRDGDAAPQSTSTTG
ncbi:MAG: cbb3-type cytochrome c oxidase subunit I, partial [Opitutales bacterium]